MPSRATTQMVVYRYRNGSKSSSRSSSRSSARSDSSLSDSEDESHFRPLPYLYYDEASGMIVRNLKSNRKSKRSSWTSVDTTPSVSLSADDEDDLYSPRLLPSTAAGLIAAGASLDSQALVRQERPTSRRSPSVDEFQTERPHIVTVSPRREHRRRPKVYVL